MPSCADATGPGAAHELLADSPDRWDHEEIRQRHQIEHVPATAQQMHPFLQDTASDLTPQVWLATTRAGHEERCTGMPLEH